MKLLKKSLLNLLILAVFVVDGYLLFMTQVPKKDPGVMLVIILVSLVVFVLLTVTKIILMAYRSLKE